MARGAALAPAENMDVLESALRERLGKTRVGDPRAEDTRMGALVSTAQRDDVRSKIAELEAAGARIVAGDPQAKSPVEGGAFLSPVLLRTDDPWTCLAPHDVEPFGPVSTIMPYADIADAVEDHYKPRFAGDTLPRNPVGIVVALADKLENEYPGGVEMWKRGAREPMERDARVRPSITGTGEPAVSWIFRVRAGLRRRGDAVGSCC